MASSVCIINAHPDPSAERLIAALCDAYERGARRGEHPVSRIDIAKLEFDLLDNAATFATPPPEPILSEREKIAAADHLFIAFPLWLGSMPAKSRAFFEQAARANFFLSTTEDNKGWPRRLMKGKSARVVVTMGMPSLFYRTLMDAGALKALERGLLGLAGVKPIRHTIYGGVDATSDAAHQHWLEDMEGLGEKAR